MATFQKCDNICVEVPSPCRLAAIEERLDKLEGKVPDPTQRTKTRGEAMAELLFAGEYGTISVAHPETHWGRYHFSIYGTDGEELRYLRQYVAAAIDKAIADEREACVRIADNRLASVVGDHGALNAVVDISANIRKRKS